MVSSRVDTGTLSGAAERVRATAQACAADAAGVAAAFGQLSLAVLDGSLAGAATGAGARWGRSIGGCSTVIGTVGAGLGLAGDRYDAVEAAAMGSFAVSR